MLAPRSDPTLIGMPVQAFRKLFQQGIGFLGCTEWGFKPYSIRRGGATELWRLSGQLSKVTLRGRWAHASTTRVYVNEGLATLAEQRLPVEPTKTLSDALAKKMMVGKTLF